MADMIEEKFIQWTRGQGDLPARISIYSGVRDIPYAVVPELNSAEKYVEILKYGKGSCMPKHFLLCNMYQRLGMLVLYAIYPFRWDEAGIDFPPRLKKLVLRWNDISVIENVPDTVKYLNAYDNPIEKIESGSIELEVTGIDLYNTLESLQSSMRGRVENKELEHLLDQWNNLTPAECVAEFRQVAIRDRMHHLSI